MFQKALDFREENSRKIDSRDEFYEFFTSSNKNDHEIHGGFAWVHWDRDPKWEEEIKNDLKVTIRCIPRDSNEKGLAYLAGTQVLAGL